MQIILTHEHADAVLGLDDVWVALPSQRNDSNQVPIFLTQQCRSRGFGGPGRSKNSHLEYCLVIAFYYFNHGLLILVFNLYQK
jgi:ribonuclease BN (tRNA processing enzyme)